LAEKFKSVFFNSGEELNQ